MVSFFTKVLRLVSRYVLRYIGEVFTKESVVFENHEIFVGILLYKKAKKVRYNLTTYVIYFCLVLIIDIKCKELNVIKSSSNKKN